MRNKCGASRPHIPHEDGPVGPERRPGSGSIFQNTRNTHSSIGPELSIGPEFQNQIFSQALNIQKPWYISR